MNRIVLVSLLGLVLSAAAFAEDADKAWDLSLESKPKVGEKVEVIKKNRMKTVMKMTQGEKVLKEDAKTESGSYEFTAETRAVDGDEETAAKWTFRTASREEGGKDVAWGFEGKTIEGKAGEGGDWEFTCTDGTALTAAELKAVKDATGKKGAKSKDEPDMGEVLRPGKPVKVGETWSPDIDAIAKSFGGENLSVDAEDSKAVCTLKSVEMRDGVPYGRIAVELDLSVPGFPPVEFDEPLHFVIAMELEACIDGTLPDGLMKGTMTLKGTRGATMRRGEQVVTFDMELGMEGTVTEARWRAK